MEVFTTEIEVVHEEAGIGIELTDLEAAYLRRVCNFNKTINKRVSERDGDVAGAEIDGFLSNLGNFLKDEGIERWDGR